MPDKSDVNEVAAVKRPPGNTSSVVDLQNSIRALVNERRELQSRLAGGKLRFRVNGGANGGSTALGNGGNAGVPNSVRGLKRDRAVFEETVTRPGASNPSMHPAYKGTKIAPLDVPADAFPVEKRPKVALDDSSMKRNRNLFGSLLGHLKKAKCRLDSEKTTKTAELQRLAEEQVSQKLDLERRNLAELRRRDFQDRQRRDLARMRDVQKELQIKEMEIVSIHVQNHFTLMKNFIATKAKPSIFWIPAVHNSVTLKMHEETQQELQKKIDAMTAQFSEEIAAFAATHENNETSSGDKKLNDSALDLDEAKHPGATLHSGVASPSRNRGQTTKPRSAAATVHPELMNDSSDEDDEPMEMTAHSPAASSTGNDDTCLSHEKPTDCGTTCKETQAGDSSPIAEHKKKDASSNEHTRLNVMGENHNESCHASTDSAPQSPHMTASEVKENGSCGFPSTRRP